MGMVVMGGLVLVMILLTPWPHMGRRYDQPPMQDDISAAVTVDLIDPVILTQSRGRHGQARH